MPFAVREARKPIPVARWWWGTSNRVRLFVVFGGIMCVTSVLGAAGSTTPPQGLSTTTDQVVVTPSDAESGQLLDVDVPRGERTR
ncbi:MAG TPA: hypothetical protein VIL00_03705 [Pseudonocardiaceae bacterium]